MRVCGFIVAQELTKYDLNMQKYYFCGFQDLTIIKNVTSLYTFKYTQTTKKQITKLYGFN